MASAPLLAPRGQCTIMVIIAFPSIVPMWNATALLLKPFRPRISETEVEK